MRTITALCILLSVACGTSRPANRATLFATAVTEAACVPLRTGETGKPDTAICEDDMVVLFCRAGDGVLRQCAPIADFRPKEQPKTGEPERQPPPQSRSQPAPFVPPPPEVAPAAKVEPAKPQPKPDTKK